MRADIGRAQSGAAEASTDLSACLCPEGGGRHGMPRTCLTSRTYAWAAEIARDDARLPERQVSLQDLKPQLRSHDEADEAAVRCGARRLVSPARYGGDVGDMWRYGKVWGDLGR